MSFTKSSAKNSPIAAMAARLAVGRPTPEKQGKPVVIGFRSDGTMTVDRTFQLYPDVLKVSQLETAVVHHLRNCLQGQGFSFDWHAKLAIKSFKEALFWRQDLAGVIEAAKDAGRDAIVTEGAYENPRAPCIYIDLDDRNAITVTLGNGAEILKGIILDNFGYEEDEETGCLRSSTWMENSESLQEHLHEGEVNFDMLVAEFSAKLELSDTIKEYIARAKRENDEAYEVMRAAAAGAAKTATIAATESTKSEGATAGSSASPKENNEVKAATSQGPKKVKGATKRKAGTAEAESTKKPKN